MNKQTELTIKLGDVILTSECIADGHFLPLRLFTVTEVKRGIFRMVDKEGNEMTITREKGKKPKDQI